MPYASYNLIGTTLEEQRNLVDDFMVLGPVDFTNARTCAPLYEVVQTCPVVVSRDGLGARPVGEQLLQQSKRLSNAGRAGEWTEVPGSVFTHLRVTYTIGKSSVVSILMNG